MDVFISHSRADNEFADRLARGLREHGLSVWVDSNAVVPELRWKEEIQKALLESNNILILVNPRIDTGPWRQFEWRTALQSAWSNPNKQLIGLLIDGAQPPPFLRSWPAIAAHSHEDLSQKFLSKLEEIIRRGPSNSNFESLPVRGLPVRGPEQASRLAEIEKEAALLAPSREDLLAEKSAVEYDLKSLSGTDSGVPDLLFKLAVINREMGDLPGALEALKRALDASEIAPGIFNPGAATILISMAALNRKLGDMRQARSQFQRALEIYTATRGETSAEVASTLALLGSVCLDMGDFESARKYFDSAVTLSSNFRGSGYPNVSALNQFLAATKQASGE